MRKITYTLLGMWLSWGIPQDVFSTTMTVIDIFGKSLEIEVQETDKFLDVIEEIQSCLCMNIAVENENENRLIKEFSQETSNHSSLNHLCFDLVLSNAEITIRAKKNWRDYHSSVNHQEKKDLGYIIKTLANDSLISIAGSKSSLKRAGERIDHIHPFRFLECVFTDEELKAGIHAIRDRGKWIWSEFISGLTGSLSEESARNNLLQFTSDFAYHIQIKEELIFPSLEQKKWTDFIGILIDEIPRKINSNRYDM